MLRLSEQTRVFLKPGVTDGRLGADGLTGLVCQVLGLDILAGDLFAFCNRRRNRIVCLLSDGSGIWVAAKRLQQGTFNGPRDEALVSQMSLALLRLLLDGFELKSRRGWQRYEQRLPAGRSRPEQLAAHARKVHKVTCAWSRCSMRTCTRRARWPLCARLARCE
jgi:transposase